MVEVESTMATTQNWSNLSVKSTEASATIARSADARNAQDVAKFSPDKYQVPESRVLGRER